MWNIIIWLLFGAIAGVIASRLMNQRNGLLVSIFVGIIGSFFAGWAMSGFKSLGTTNVSILGLLGSILGAVVFLAILNFFRFRRL